MELRYHTDTEFSGLSQEQYEELLEWRRTTGNYANSNEEQTISAAKQVANSQSMIEMLQHKVATLKSEKEDNSKTNPLQPPPKFGQRKK